MAFTAAAQLLLLSSAARGARSRAWQAAVAGSSGGGAAGRLLARGLQGQHGGTHARGLARRQPRWGRPCSGARGLRQPAASGPESATLLGACGCVLGATPCVEAVLGHAEAAPAVASCLRLAWGRAPAPARAPGPPAVPSPCRARVFGRRRLVRLSRTSSG